MDTLEAALMGCDHFIRREAPCDCFFCRTIERTSPSRGGGLRKRAKRRLNRAAARVLDLVGTSLEARAHV